MYTKFQLIPPNSVRVMIKKQRTTGLYSNREKKFIKTINKCNSGLNYLLEYKLDLFNVFSLTPNNAPLKKVLIKKFL